MAWARYDDSFFSHRKVLRAKAEPGTGPAGLAALGLHLVMNTWSRHTGSRGFVPDYAVNDLAGSAEAGEVLANLLAKLGLLDRDEESGEPGWRIHDFADYSAPGDDGRSAEDRKRELSAKRAEAGRLGGIAKALAKQSAGNPVALPEQTPAPVPVPEPKDLSARKRAAGPSTPEDPAPAQRIVAAYVEGAVNAGLPQPAGTLCARVGKQAKAMLTAHPEDQLVNAARSMGAAGWHDLAVQVQRDARAARPLRVIPKQAPPGSDPHRAHLWEQS